MGVYVKGMKIPKMCLWCPLRDIGLCQITKTDINFISGRRADDCPLVEVTEPHGKLIDANELSNKMRCLDWHVLVFRNGAALDISKFNDIIRNIETVIEAEGE